MVELAVTMGIFVMLTSVVLANYRTFSNNSDFLNVGDNIALSLREAQIYGVGSKGAGTECGTSPTLLSTFNCAYGVSFTKGDSVYTIFVDVDGNTIYDAGELIETVYLPSGISLTEIGGVDRVDISFKRPDADAIIMPMTGGLSGPRVDSVGITVENTTKKSVVSVTRTGQISVTTTNKSL